MVSKGDGFISTFYLATNYCNQLCYGATCRTCMSTEDANCHDAFNADVDTCEFSDFAGSETKLVPRKDAGGVASCKFTQAELHPESGYP